MRKKHYSCFVLAAYIVLFAVLLSSCAGSTQESTTLAAVSETAAQTVQTTENISGAPTTALSPQTQAEPETYNGTPLAEYRFDCEASRFSPGESFTLVLSVDCAEFCSGSCVVSFNSNVLTCTSITLTEIDGVKGITDNTSLKNGVAVVSLYSARPVNISYARAALLEFTVNENVRSDTDSAVSFLDGTVCIKALNGDGTQISDITGVTALLGFEFNVI